MNHFMERNSALPAFMAFPKFLLDDVHLSETAKILYMVLLDRARISMKNDGWADDTGHVFIFFPIQSLARTLHKSEMTVKTGLKALEEEELIKRVRQGTGLPNRIYVKLPEDRKLPAAQTESHLPDGQKTVSPAAENLSANQKEEKYMKGIKTTEKGKPCGYFQNVYLTDAERAALRREIPQLDAYIERLSGYMASTGKTYASHAATIRSWALRDHPARQYDCEEDESL